MSSRITSNMLTSNYLRNMKNNLNNMKTLQNQLASGRTIQKASDNPYIASRSMQLNAEISYNKQYNENIKDTSNWLDTTDTALSQMGNIFGRIETLLVNAGNGSYGEDERTAIQDEIKEKVNELSQVLNTSFDGSYIFGGTKTGSKPTTVDSNGKLQYANSKGEVVNVYINSADKTTNSSTSSNVTLKSTDAVYLDPQTGKVTTSDKSIDGTTKNTQIIQTGSLYVAPDGTVSTLSSGGNQLYLKDDLYVDLNGNYTASETTENTLITSDDELLYSTPTGQVTAKYDPTYTIIPTGQTLYRDSSGNVTPSSAGNTAIDSSSPLYTDEKGFVTTSAITINTKLSDVTPTPITSVTGVQLSTYTSGTGYTQTAIISPYDVYMDSRGVLTDSSTTDLSLRSATLKQLWENSYIDSADEQLKGGIPAATSSNKQIHLYKDSTGQVTTSPGSYPANEQILLGTTLYKDSTTGKVTTAVGTGNTPIQLDENVYVELNGEVTTNSTVTNKVVSLRDNLSITTASYTDNAKAVIGSVPATDSAIPSDTVTLYVDAATGNISKNSTGTKIILGDSLYLDSYGNISTLNETPNTLVNSDDKLYSDANGNITNLAANVQITSGTALYKDAATGSVTTSSGGTPPNEVIDLNNASLYQDAKGNVTTLSTGNTSISNTTNLYKDVNGNITTIAKNTQITSDTKLYLDNGNITITPSGTLAAGTQLYKDGSGNITTSAGGSPPTNTLIATTPIVASALYVDASGNLTDVSTLPNMPIPSGTELYNDGTGIVKTKLIKTGEPLYVNSNGKITKDAITSNAQLSINDKIYADAAGNLTMSSTSTNKQITMSDVRSLKNELQSLSSTGTRAIEINRILSNADVAQLVQLDSGLTVDIAQGIKSTYNKTAANVLEFKDKTGKSINVSDLLSNIITDLGLGGTTNNLITAHLTDIQSVTANLLQQRSEVGSYQNRMDSAQSSNETQNYNMTDILSKTEDIDFAETTMNYSMMQTVYTAALQTSAKILPMTILSYL